MTAFIDEYRDVYGVGPICRTLPIAPSTYYAAKAITRSPDKASPRSRHDAELKEVMKDLWQKNQSVYGYKKLWHALRRKGHDVARCTVARLMREMGIRGVVRGKKVITTNPDTARPCPDDKVNRKFIARPAGQTGPISFGASRVARHRSERSGERFHICFELVRHGLCRLRH